MTRLASLVENDFPITDLTPKQNKIFYLLSQGKSLQRKKLVKKLSVARTTIFDNLAKLRRKGLVLCFSKNAGIRGRPTIFWYIPKYIPKYVRTEILSKINMLDVLEINHPKLPIKNH